MVAKQNFGQMFQVGGTEVHFYVMAVVACWVAMNARREAVAITPSSSFSAWFGREKTKESEQNSHVIFVVKHEHDSFAGKGNF